MFCGLLIFCLFRLFYLFIFIFLCLVVTFFLHPSLFPSCVAVFLPRLIVSLHLHLQFVFKPVSSSCWVVCCCRHVGSVVILFLSTVSVPPSLCLPRGFSTLVFVSPSLLLSVCKLTFSYIPAILLNKSSLQLQS